MTFRTPELLAHYEQMRATTLATLFAADAQRFAHFSLEVNVGHEKIFLDYSKNHATRETMQLLGNLAKACGVSEALRALHTGATMNQSEQRPALHSALRSAPDEVIRVDGHNIVPMIHDVLARMEAFVNEIHETPAITDIINIGIGGSDLGPAMMTAALSPYAVTDKRVHFVSNGDTGQIRALLKTLVPQKTLIIISSKSFKTPETRENARIALEWLDAAGVALAQHVVAVTANIAAACALGILPERIFPLWSWVGGRYSIWSAMGLPVALKIGMANFRDFLSGARAMDHHVRAAPLAKNLPVILALFNIWYINFFGADTRAILPYDYRLARFPAYLQQLEMESNGKRVRQNGFEAVEYATGPIIWGEPGTNGQHAFHQLLHQGTQFVPVDFIIARRPHADDSNLREHALLFANCLAQAEVLLQGSHPQEFYRNIPGNRPSNMVMLSALTPATLGALIALYEHKVFVSAWMWDINPFDQWGVETGKQIAEEIYLQLSSEEKSLEEPAIRPERKLDSSTQGLMRYFKDD